MADELSSCYESLSAIFRYSGEATRLSGVEEFSQQLLSDLLRVTGNAWYVFRLLRSDAGELAVFACSDAGLSWEPLKLTQAAVEAAPCEVEAACQRRDVWFEDGSQLRPGDPLGRLGAGCGGLVHPLYLGETLVGTLAVGGPPAGRRFTASQTNVTQTFADFLAIQVVNARFQEERVRALLAAQELRIANQIQRSLLPTHLPEAPGLLLAATCESASEVGGDFFDVISLETGGFLVVVSDAMGKGLPAAMFAMILRSLLRALQDQGPRPGTLLRRANSLLHSELSKVEMFITTQLAFVDAQASRLVVSSAGHCPLLHCAGPGQPVEALSPDGMPLGVLPDMEFGESTIELRPGCRLLMYTDGVTETTAPGGEFFGQVRLSSWLAGETATRQGADAMQRSLIAALAEHQGSPVLVDDQTFVILGR
jgi:serine phosphatase RsbU (regulator of sigma subunit)